jgi:pimeloyl-ACP methyl ester carboxylesterase
MSAPLPRAFPERPSRVLVSADGTPIAVFSAGSGPALILVHGTTADHRTWRVLGPMLAERHALHAIDRRGRGDSGDGPGPYSIGLELDDLAAVADAVASETGGPVDVLGHSLGGRIALGASIRARSIRRVLAYESAPASTLRAPGERDELLEALRADLARGDNDALLARFMTDAVGMPPADLAAFRANPIWALRSAAAPTIVRELDAADAAPEVSMDALAAVRAPVLQVAGSASPPSFREAAVALDARLADGRLAIIEGARHAAHHSHPTELLRLVEAFLAG